MWHPRSLFIITPLAYALFSLPVQAKQPDDDHISTPAVKSGFQTGSFLIKPELALTGGYDDNVFSTRTDTISDTFYIFSPSVSINSDWQKHELNFIASADMGRYQTLDTEDYDDFSLGTSGRIDLNDNDNLFAGLSFSKAHESRSSPDSFFGLYPTEYTSTDAHLGTVQQFTNWGFRLGGTFQKLNYDDVPTLNNILNNDDRDRNIYGLGLRLSFNKSALFSPFTQLVYDKRQYQNSSDDNGFQRDSNGYRLAIGFTSTSPNSFKSEVYIGHLQQDYDDARFSTISKPDFGISLRWLSSPSTLITAIAERDITETTLFGASAAVETSYTTQLKHRLLPYLILNAHAGLNRYDYQKIARRDDYAEAGFGLDYDLTPHLSLSADYRYVHRDSSVDYAMLADSLDYSSHQLFLTLNARLYPVRQDLQASISHLLNANQSATQTTDGFYLGTQFGYNGVDTHTSETDNNNTETSNFGDAASAYGLFAGYGRSVNSWYFGVELEAEQAHASWQRYKDKADSRTSTLEKTRGYAASLQLGHSLLNNTLLYARLGAVRSQFNAYETVNNSPQNAFDETFSLTGLRMGVGIRFDLSKRLFAKMDYSVSNYRDKDFATSDLAEHLTIHESLFNLGLGWHFDDVAKPTISINPDTVAGPYAGFQMGYGMTASELNGWHHDSGSGPYAYSGDFADHGFTPGVFAGYAVNWQQLLLALEVEGEVTSLQWQHNRTTSGGGGRDFSVEVHETVGAAIKLGYILKSGSLVYLKAGAVRTNFTTQWAKGSNTALHIERDDHLNGIRLGIGAEIPITRQSFVRLDYSHTNYDAYDFVSAHGAGSNADEMHFDTTTELFRLGIGIRF